MFGVGVVVVLVLFVAALAYELASLSAAHDAGGSGAQPAGGNSERSLLEIEARLRKEILATAEAQRAVLQDHLEKEDKVRLQRGKGGRL